MTSSLQSFFALLLAFLPLISTHTIITYPGWRGDNLHTNDTFPYGMQWMYPCGGMGPSTNRTLWPINGGAVSVQPGWFQGHSTAFMYINMGFGTTPPNYSNPMVPVFQIQGPDNLPYPGSFCLPQVPLPTNAPLAGVAVGQNATIQVVEAAKHGAGLFNCVDITFAEASDVPEVNSSNCINSSDISFNYVYTIAQNASSSDAVISLVSPSMALFSASTVIAVLTAVMWL